MGADDSRAGSVWKWIVVAILAAGAVYVFMRPHLVEDPTDPKVLMQDVQLKCAETGYEWKLNRGRMQSYLYSMAADGKLDLTQGLENPKTGKRTGFPVDRADWERTVARILKESAEAKSQVPKIPDEPSSGTPPKGT